MNQENVISNSKNLITVKNVLRALFLCCTILAFCPSFLVSCSGKNVEVSLMTAVGGLEMFGEMIVEPHVFMIICLIIPVGLLILTFLKKVSKKVVVTSSLLASIIDTIIWICFRNKVKEVANQAYSDFKVTGWYVLNIIILLLIILISVLLITKKIEMETDVFSIITNIDKENAKKLLTNGMNQAVSAVSNVSEKISETSNGKNKNIVGYCSKCGKQIKLDNRFCVNCGTPVPKNILEEAERVKKEIEEEEKKKFCPVCGKEKINGAVFCENCGTKLK